MDKIIEQASNWQYLRQLPAEYAGFSLNLEQVQQGGTYVLFSYQSDKHRSFTVLYDSATKDFLARVVVGLTEYYVLDFISSDFAALEQTIDERLKRTLENLADPSAQNYENIFRAKKILEWSYSSKLPLELSGFRLFVDPRRSVKTINGSYVIIDYSDFSVASNLVIYYNIYRDEFFGEVRLRRTPLAVSLFETGDLTELAAKLDTNLSQALVKLRSEIDCQAQDMEVK